MNGARLPGPGNWKMHIDHKNHRQKSALFKINITLIPHNAVLKTAYPELLKALVFSKVFNLVISTCIHGYITCINGFIHVYWI